MGLPGQRRHGRPALLHGRLDAGLPFGQARPGGGLSQVLQHQAGQIFLVGQQGQRLFKLASGLLEALQVFQRLGLQKMGLRGRCGVLRGCRRAGQGPPRLQLLHALQQLGGGLLVVFGAGAHVFAHERGGGGRHGFRAAQAQLRLQGRMRLRSRLQRGQQRQRAGVVIQRFFQPAQPFSGHAPAVKSGSVIGLERHGAVKGRHGLLQPPQRQQDVAQVVLQDGVIGLHLRGLLQPAQRLLQLPLLRERGAQQVERVKVPRVALQNLRVALARLLQLAQMLVGQALLEQDADVGSGRRHGRRGSWARKAKGADANQWPRTGRDVFFSADLRFF